jgi:hypothetical protein
MDWFHSFILSRRFWTFDPISLYTGSLHSFGFHASSATVSSLPAYVVQLEGLGFISVFVAKRPTVPTTTSLTRRV